MTRTRLYVAGAMSAASFCPAGEDASACRQRLPWSAMECPVHGPNAPDPWDFNYPAFAAAQEQLEAAGFVVESPHAPGQVEGWSWGDYMRRGLGQLLTCEGVALLPGWSGSRGAKLEVQVAAACGLRVQSVPAWLAEGPPARPVT